MTLRLRSWTLCLAALLSSACAAEGARSSLYAQRRGALPTCTSADSECTGKVRMPRARNCGNGRQSTPSACCRMGYCGVCWSECGR